jgi:hypothetical protein
MAPPSTTTVHHLGPGWLPAGPGWRERHRRHHGSGGSNEVILAAQRGVLLSPESVLVQQFTTVPWSSRDPDGVMRSRAGS